MSFQVKDQAGNIINIPAWDPAYSTFFTLTAAQTATPTTLFQLGGAAGVVVRLKYMQVAIRAGSAASSTGTVFTINRRTAAASGGTSASPTIISHDTNNATASAVPLYYTAFPTVGTGGGVIRQFTATLAGTAADNTDQLFTYQWADKADQPLVLRTATQYITLELATALSTAQHLEVNIQWDEAVAANPGGAN